MSAFILPESLATLAARALARLQPLAETPFTADFIQRLQHLAVVSDFAIDTLCRQPTLLNALAQGTCPDIPAPVLHSAAADQWSSLLRRYRAAVSTCLIWRDIQGLDHINHTLAASSQLAQTCLQLALQAVETQFMQQHGVVRTAEGDPVRLVVFGLGKLGGAELNFSSDIDLVYAFAQGGQAAENYFARLGQRLTRLLDESTAEGFCYRVDVRLRPFGTSGQLAQSFAAMDHYFQREGRDWERYAWIKARPVAGDMAAGHAWLESLRPFVYRRYLDYTALDGLREMKAAIAIEVARQDRADDIKRGPGGIREIEFLVQCLQLIRGGREASLRQCGLLPALQALMEAGHIAPAYAAVLAKAYRFERHVENRLQMLRDAQTHALPTDALERQRIASGLGYGDWSALMQVLQAQRQQVSTEFAALLAVHQPTPLADDLASYWRKLPENASVAALQTLGLSDIDRADQILRHFAASLAVKALSDSARARLDRVVPALLHAIADTPSPDATLSRVLGLLQAILRRTSYLALLDEQPDALQRLVQVLAHSALLGERLQHFPLLLDELLDARVAGPLPDASVFHSACRNVLHIEDTEAALRSLNEIRLALSFRLALAFHDGRLDAVRCTCLLAQLADAVVAVSLKRVYEELVTVHGSVPEGRFAVIAYGSLGALELGFGSDLDLIFLYDQPQKVSSSTGPRSLTVERWFTRLAQKLMALLAANSAAGRLYDIDIRLRPDGAKGALVSSLNSYRHYQQTRAWTWEHLALVRARGIAGDSSLLADFEQLRSQILTQPRARDQVLQEAASMRARMRSELDRSRLPQALDLKQGPGALVDLGFIVQTGVLAQAAIDSQLCLSRQTPPLITTLQQSGWLSKAHAADLHHAHQTLLHAALRCTLDRRPRISSMTSEIRQACTIVSAMVKDHGVHG